MPASSSRMLFWSCVIGNVLDHYDTALYGLFAPLIAPYFFPNHDPIVALILTYGLMSTSLLTRPLGALFFGRWSERYGAHKTLAITLGGIALLTGLIGLIPNYDQIGCFAPMALALLRSLQGFFAAGENSIASLLLVHHAPIDQQGRASSIYHSSSVLGILLASAIAAIITTLPEATLYWRYPFIAGLCTGFAGWLLRVYSPAVTVKLAPPRQLYQLLWMHKGAIMRVMMVSSFTYLTYAIPFLFMNSFIPHVSSVSLKEMMWVNTALLLFDMVMLPVFGWVSDRLPKASFMACMAGLLAFSAIPLFLYIPHATIIGVTLIRMWIVVIGLAYVAPLHAWFYRQFPGEEKYLLTGFGYALGTEIFGRTTPAICLWLWYQTHWVGAPALYMIFISILALAGLMYRTEKIPPSSLK